jgi:uncharacterized protein with PIN domain
MKTIGQNKAVFLAEATAMYDELAKWRAENEQASFDEIAGQVTVKRQALMGELLRGLALQGVEEKVEIERRCVECGGPVHAKGKKRRTVLHAEGQAALERGYYQCDQCGHSFFPSGQDVATW